jgi:hypothetical protein
LLNTLRTTNYNGEVFGKNSKKLQRMSCLDLSKEKEKKKRRRKQWRVYGEKV